MSRLLFWSMNAIRFFVWQWVWSSYYWAVYAVYLPSLLVNLLLSLIFLIHTIYLSGGRRVLLLQPNAVRNSWQAMNELTRSTKNDSTRLRCAACVSMGFDALSRRAGDRSRWLCCAGSYAVRSPCSTVASATREYTKGLFRNRRLFCSVPILVGVEAQLVRRVSDDWHCKPDPSHMLGTPSLRAFLSSLDPDGNSVRARTLP